MTIEESTADLKRMKRQGQRLLAMIVSSLAVVSVLMVWNVYWMMNGKAWEIALNVVLLTVNVLVGVGSVRNFTMVRASYREVLELYDLACLTLKMKTMAERVLREAEAHEDSKPQ